jgi:hypothetical protein
MSPCGVPTLDCDDARASCSRVRRETERAFAGLPRDEIWIHDAISTNLVSAGLSAVARWFKKDS